MSMKCPTTLLPSGQAIPTVGFGVYQITPGPTTYNAVREALRLGYRHVDTAQAYRNEEDTGSAVRDSGIPREEIFITSKLVERSCSYDDAVKTIKQCNDRIGCGYIDLYLLHAPFDSETRGERWRALEDMQKEGIVKDIGISNFGINHIKKLLSHCRVKPAVNQMELHPWLQRKELVEYCKNEGILMEAYSPLVRGQKFDDPVAGDIAKESGATPAQVMIAWSLAKGFVTLPKSEKAARIKENFEAMDLKLTADQMERLDGLDANYISGWDPASQHDV